MFAKKVRTKKKVGIIFFSPYKKILLEFLSARKYLRYTPLFHPSTLALLENVKNIN